MKKLFNGKIKKFLIFLTIASLFVGGTLLSGCDALEFLDALSQEVESTQNQTSASPAKSNDTFSESTGIIGGADKPTSVVIAGEDKKEELPDGLPQEGEFYYDVENVVLYLELYHELPLNYITKKEAEKRGWQGGSVEDYVEDAAIGGDHFGNYEGILPQDDYKECDIDTYHYKNRGSRRLIYTDDGKYYYTKDHYETFMEVTVDKDYKVTIHQN